MIPDFDENGNLVLGIHFATLGEVEKRFVYNSHRRALLKG
jgi:hypothetical protein